MAQYIWGDTGKPLPLLDFAVKDQSWLKHLPQGSTVISNVGHGSSYWSQAVKLEVRLPDDSIQRYFLKLTETPIGKVMCEGEYESMKLFHQIVPEHVPRPIAWGSFDIAPDVNFIMCEFVDIIDESYAPMSEFCAQIARMHKLSEKYSPGKCGFQVPTCNGIVAQLNDWNVSWEAFYVAKLRAMFDRDEALYGTCPEYDALKEPLFNKVCPRLLRPLETGGRTLKLCLNHGDLWDGNVGLRADGSRGSLLWDAAAFWGHNEYDLKSFHGQHYKFDGKYVDEYFKHFPPSEPVEDCCDRHLLYIVGCELLNAIMYPPVSLKHSDMSRYRRLVIKYVTELVEKFPDGYQGEFKCKADE